MRPKLITVLLSVVLFVLTPSILGQTTETRDERFIADARSAYYNLARQGFAGFHASIEPDWKVILADSATKDNLKVFRSLRFSMVVDASGAVTVNHEFGDEKPFVKEIHGHLQRLLSSFFGTWAFFMISSPFSGSEVRIERIENGYNVSYRMQSTEVTLSMSSDFLITEARLFDSTSRRTVRPVFQKTPTGFVLLSYHIVFEPLSQGNKTTIETTIDYRDLGGMRLPNKIHIKGMYGGEPVEAELKFSDCVLTLPSSR